MLIADGWQLQGGAGMFAWRGRVGLVNPTQRGKVLHYWYRFAPDGVEIVPAVIGFRRGEREQFAAGLDRAVELATELRGLGCDVIAVSGTPPFLLAGLDYEREWGQNLAAKLGCPVVTSMEPGPLALQTIGARRVAVATYYGPELNQAIATCFERFGIEALLLDGYSLNDEREGLYTTPLRALDGVGWADVYRYCRDGVRALGTRIDALYINGAGWDYVPALDLLERDLQTRVISATNAEMWLTYRRLGISHRVEGVGVLMREYYDADV
jgi:maleate cis-trans isomerase